MRLAAASLTICKACRSPTLKDGLYKRSSSESEYSKDKIVKANISYTAPSSSVLTRNKKKANP